MLELYKLDDKYTILLDIGGHDIDLPHFLLAYEGLEKSFFESTAFIPIFLNKPDYFHKSTKRISKKTAEKLSKAMKSIIEINEPNFYLKGTLWNLCVWFWNNQLYYGQKSKQVKNDIAFMPNYLELETIDDSLLEE